MGSSTAGKDDCTGFPTELEADLSRTAARTGSNGADLPSSGCPLSRILKAVGTFDDHLLHPNQSGQSPHVLPLMRLGKSRGLFGDVKKSWASPLQFRRHPQC